MGSQRTLHEPLGFDQGDPLIICRSGRDEDIRESFKRIQLKGYYCGYMSTICGRRFDRIIFDMHVVNMSHKEFVQFWHWIAESVMTTTPPGGAKEICFV